MAYERRPGEQWDNLPPEIQKEFMDNAKASIGKIHLTLDGSEAMRLSWMIMLDLCGGNTHTAEQMFDWLGMHTSQCSTIEEGVEKFFESIDQVCEEKGRNKCPRYAKPLFIAVATNVIGAGKNMFNIKDKKKGDDDANRTR